MLTSFLQLQSDTTSLCCNVWFLQLRANALIKRGSMYMQQQQPLLSTQDFNMAAEIDTRNPDVYHHRGQVGDGTDFFNKKLLKVFF